MIHLIGIKGAGMASLAAILQDLGYEVQGSDLPRHFFTEETLRQRNIPVFDFDPKNIAGPLTVIIGNAFHDDFPEVAAALASPLAECYRYHDYVGKLMCDFQSFSVAGSHGKTTTATMLSDMLMADAPCAYLIGDGNGKVETGAKRLVVESCEFRRHFLSYYPDYAIFTNVELDHVDYYKSREDYYRAYEEFAENVKRKIVLYGDDPEVRALKIDKDKTVYYGEEPGNDIQAYEVIQYNDKAEFKVKAYGRFYGSYRLPLVGKHMLANALACIGIGYLLGMDSDISQQGLSTFKGARRRYVVEEQGDNVFIDDYAHHPTEVDMTIKATKLRYPNKKIVAVFKPHRASRLVRFIDEYENALRQADYCGVCEFTSIDDFDDGTEISVSYLTKRIPDCRIFRETAEDVNYLAGLAPAVFLFMSSKDIYDFATALKTELSNRQ